jgi:EmrB/QacA subfamily drug resistance transporter
VERKWWTLIAVCVAIFMLLLDITVVNVALPDIQRSLHSSFADLQWVVNAYALTLAAFLLTSGSVADLIGRKRVFIAGLFVFTTASAVCGLSTTPLMLNLARAVQGVGGAMMFATALALIAQAFHGKERGTAFGVFGAVTGAAVAVGPVLGGIITSGLGWKWIFFVNVPIGIVAVFIAFTKVADSRDPNATGVDWAGLVTFSGALFLLVYALVQGNEKGWGSTEIVTLLVLAVALLATFVLVEHRQSRPMLDLALFRRPAFTGASIVAFTLSSSFFAMFLYLTLYIQDVLGYSPFQAGLRFLPTTLLSFIVAPIAGRLSVRMPVRLLLGSGLALIGLGLLAMTTVDATSTWTVLIPGFILAGAGVGLVNPPLASTAIGVVPQERSGMASGINSTFRQVGIATGIAGLGAVFQHSVTQGTTAALRSSGQTHAILGAAHGQLGTLLESGEVTQIAHSLSGAARAALDHSYRVGFTEAFTTIALIAAAIALVGAVLAFVLVRSRDFVSAGEVPVAQGADTQGAEPVTAVAG